MTTIQDKINFNFDGDWSYYFGLLNVVLDSSMYEETFVASREIVETEARGYSKPIFHSINSSPIQFGMTIAFEDCFEKHDTDLVIDWLFKDYYRPLYFEGKEDRIFMAMFIGDPTIVHNGLKQGYFTVQVRCDSPFLYSRAITTPLNTVTDITTIEINNDGHTIIYPEISILKNGSGTIVIESLDDNGDIFEVRDLSNQEDIYLNCEKETIKSDVIGVERYDNLNGEFPRILKGINRFRVTGSCAIQFRYVKKYNF